MNTNTIKIKKGGIDSIVAFIVVLLPLVYVLIYMVATLYHFGVQMYLNQVVKETLVMASTYGDYTLTMENEYLKKKVEPVAGIISVEFYVREFYTDGTVSDIKTDVERRDGVIKYISDDDDPKWSHNGQWVPLQQGDLLGIYVESESPSLLGTVSAFNIFGTSSDVESTLKYSSYREEIIRNGNGTL